MRRRGFLTGAAVLKSVSAGPADLPVERLARILLAANCCEPIR